MRPRAIDRARTRLIALNARIRACRRCHLAGLLDECESVPIARDPEPDADVPRILLVGQAPGLRATLHDRPFAGLAGEKLRAWLEQGGSRARTSTAASTSPPSPAATPAACPARRATASPRRRSRTLPPLARRAGRHAPARGRPPRRPAGDPDVPRAREVVDGRRRHLRGPRRRPLHPLAPSLGRQPLAERAGQRRGRRQGDGHPQTSILHDGEVRARQSRDPRGAC